MEETIRTKVSDREGNKEGFVTENGGKPTLVTKGHSNQVTI